MQIRTIKTYGKKASRTVLVGDPNQEQTVKVDSAALYSIPDNQAQVGNQSAKVFLNARDVSAGKENVNLNELSTDSQRLQNHHAGLANHGAVDGDALAEHLEFSLNLSPICAKNAIYNEFCASTPLKITKTSSDTDKICWTPHFDDPKCNQFISATPTIYRIAETGNKISRPNDVSATHPQQRDVDDIDQNETGNKISCPNYMSVTHPQQRDVDDIDQKSEPSALELLVSLSVDQNINPFEETVTKLLDFPKNRTEESTSRRHSALEIVKIGEATFSEVFSVRTLDECATVMKVIPFYLPGNKQKFVNGELMTSVASVLHEVTMTKTLSEHSRSIDFCGDSLEHRLSNFVKFNGVYIVKGRYPEYLLRAWDLWRNDNSNESENERPDFFDKEQLFCILLLEHGGIDVEHWVSTRKGNRRNAWNWSRITSIISQISLALANAEIFLKFEHRDLHWGNILIKEIQESVVQFNVDNFSFSVDTHQIQPTIIDYTFSRLLVPYSNEILFRPFDDDSYFEGEGDYQFEVYRKMRDIIQKNETEALMWRGFAPKTNVFWLHYLVDIFLQKAKRNRSKNDGELEIIKRLQNLYDDMLSYESCRDLVKEHKYFEKIRQS